MAPSSRRETLRYTNERRETIRGETDRSTPYSDERANRRREQGHLGGEPQGALAFRRHPVGFIFQSFNLFPGLIALENVQFEIDVSARREEGVE